MSSAAQGVPTWARLHQASTKTNGRLGSNVANGGGRTPIPPARKLEEMGFATVTQPVGACYTIAWALRET